MNCVRVILLGASNLQLAMPLLLENLARQFLPEAERLEIWAASGHGRSYGNWSRVLFRELPGIVNCRLWEDLRQSPILPDKTYALITDIGNDLLFGQFPVQIAAWTRTVFERLVEARAQMVVTGLPLATIRSLPSWKFRLVKNLIFPSSRLTLLETLVRAEELHGRVAELAVEFGVPLVEPEPLWYGFDPIHIHRTARAAAWRQILTGWNAFPEDSPFLKAEAAAVRRVRNSPPFARRLFGRTTITPQPVQTAELHGGLAFSAY